MCGHQHSLTLVGPGTQLKSQRSLRLTVHAARWLVQRDHGGSLTIAGDYRQSQALAFPSGQVSRVALGDVLQAGPLQRALRKLVADVLVQEVVAGVLQEQRDPAAALDLAASLLQEAGGVTQQGGLASPVAPHQCDAFTRFQDEVDAAQDRRAVAKLVPDTVHPQ